MAVDRAVATVEAEGEGRFVAWLKYHLEEVVRLEGKGKERTKQDVERLRRYRFEVQGALSAINALGLYETLRSAYYIETGIRLPSYPEWLAAQALHAVIGGG